MRNALVDLTGGIGEVIRLTECGPYFNLYKIIRHALDTNSLMGASIKVGACRRFSPRDVDPFSGLYLSRFSSPECDVGAQLAF